ncbi:UNVERIFIED_CONTAM: hypothetical protein Slati_1082500 [Sesamum latifolium]|uniref:Uncharacterized protein n=1 Tax=Sesamum latifolium TaxID=2727402 RepID=A0AAW2XUW2_9LAMI
MDLNLKLTTFSPETQEGVGIKIHRPSALQTTEAHLQGRLLQEDQEDKKRWWRNALLFFKFPKWAPPGAAATRDLGGARHRIGSISGPVYITESRSGSSTPYSRAGSGPLMKGEMEIPYISLRELNMEENRRVSGAATPIYLVT